MSWGCVAAAITLSWSGLGVGSRGRGGSCSLAPFGQSVLAVAEMETSFVDQEEGLAPLLPVLALGFLAVL